MAKAKRTAEQAQQIEEANEQMEKVDRADFANLKADVEVTFDCPFPIHVNGVRYEGIVTVPKHMAESMIPMVQAKMKSDLAIFVGKKYLVQRLADNTLVVREGVDVTPKR